MNAYRTDLASRAAAAVIRRVLLPYRYALAFVRHSAPRQPEPAHRPGPPQVARVVTLTWYEDGALGTPCPRKTAAPS
jgi:hypothetical protein